MLAKARQFFHERSICEVDCPILSREASVDAHIDVISTHDGHFLHTSPEYGMKRLLAEGMGDIYQLSHVFRDGEMGEKHNPEFMMAEWYRVGVSFEEIIEETLDFIRLFLGNLPSTKLSYREAFKNYTGIDYTIVSEQELVEYLEGHDIQVHEKEKNSLLNVILGLIIEPNLVDLSVLIHYPATQAALAQTTWNGDEHVSERFEIYYQGMELANGYHELTDPIEQRRRLVEANHQREKMGKQRLPLDENFLQALEKGLPDCCGVAVGFDRLMMLRHNRQDIRDVIPFR